MKRLQLTCLLTAVAAIAIPLTVSEQAQARDGRDDRNMVTVRRGNQTACLNGNRHCRRDHTRRIGYNNNHNHNHNGWSTRRWR